MWFINNTNRVGLLGVIASLVAVGIVFLHIALGPIEDPSPFDAPSSEHEHSLATAITNALRVNNEPIFITMDSIDLDSVVKYLVIGLGVVSILFGAAGALRTGQWQQGSLSISIATSLFIFYFSSYYCWGTLSCYLR